MVHTIFARGDAVACAASTKARGTKMRSTASVFVCVHCIRTAPSAAVGGVGGGGGLSSAAAVDVDVVLIALAAAWRARPSAVSRASSLTSRSFLRRSSIARILRCATPLDAGESATTASMHARA